MQLFHSAVTKGGWRGDLLLLAYELEGDDLSWFEDRGIQVYHCPDLPYANDICAQYKWPEVVWHKLHILKPYFRQWERLLFLDGDILIHSSITNLANVHEFSAVSSNQLLRDELLTPMGAMIRGYDTRKRIDMAKTFDLANPAFNCGLMAFPTSAIPDDAFEKAMELRRAYGEMIIVPEQAILNLMIPKWHALPNAYNIYPFSIRHETHLDISDIEPIMTHFIIEKPWVPSHPQHGEWIVACNAARNSPAKPLLSPELIDAYPVAHIMPEAQIRDIERWYQEGYRKGIFKRFRNRLIGNAEMMIGLCGILIRRFSPRAYRFLKNKPHQEAAISHHAKQA